MNDEIISKLFQNITVLTDEEMLEKQNDFNEEQKQKRYENSGVGEKYWKYTLNDYIQKTEEQKNTFSKILDFIKSVKKKLCRTLWLCGNSGTGKTMLSALIIRECGGRFVKSYQIEDEIDDSRYFAQERRSEIIKRYSNISLLVIDEVGKFESQTELKFLFEILNERYEKEKPTVIVTNKTKAELKEYLGKPLFDRFIENCIAIEFTGESYRALNRCLQ